MADDEIDMNTAIAVADGKMSGDKLTDKQRQLVEVVKEERKTQGGRELTDEAAQNNYTLKVEYDKRRNGLENDGDRSIAVKLAGDHGQALSLDVRQETLHHELVHADQALSGNGKPPEGLSSFDRALWGYGRERQAFVAEEEDRRERKGLPPLTDEEKRTIFADRVAGAYYAETYKFAETSREDGRHLTEKEFENAFGVTPGNKNNFLTGGNYTDPVNIFDSPDGKNIKDGTLHRVRMEEEGVQIPYDQLPQSGGSVTRAEGKDGNIFSLSIGARTVSLRSKPMNVMTAPVIRVTMSSWMIESTQTMVRIPWAIPAKEFIRNMSLWKNPTTAKSKEWKALQR